jgi:5'-3' exonuclease
VTATTAVTQPPLRSGPGAFGAGVFGARCGRGRVPVVTHAIPTDPTVTADRGDTTARRQRVLGVDGNSLGHRGFHSGRDEAERGDAPPTYVTGAVLSMIASAWSHGPYDALVVAFDHASNRRKADYPSYKAHRPETHADLPGALADLRTHLRAAGLAVVEHDGAEADDVLAALVDACNAEAWNCDLLSSDRDLTALVGPRTRLLRPRARFADLVVEDEAAVRVTYGIDPAQYIDLAALRGDPSDGLVGARGIGPKTAARLVRDHGGVAGIYAALCHLPPRIEASLREARQRVEHNLLVMAPIPHLTVDVAGALRAGIDLERVVSTFAGLGLEPAARRFARALTTPAVPPRPASPPPPEEPARVRVAVRVRRQLVVDAVEQPSLF